VEVVIPRPGPTGEEVPGVGKVCVYIFTFPFSFPNVNTAKWQIRCAMHVYEGIGLAWIPSQE
jgi:hypothetical protein